MAVGGNADLIPGRMVRRSGAFTKAAYLRSVEPSEIEARLGFRRGRLAEGWWLLLLTEMPKPDDFDYIGHPPLAVGAQRGVQPAAPGAVARPALQGPELRRAKERTIVEVFTLKGSARLAMAVPKASASGEASEQAEQRLSGIPLWELKPDRSLHWKVAAWLAPGEVYNGFYV